MSLIEKVLCAGVDSRFLLDSAKKDMRRDVHHTTQQ